jgi:hypothetical protein
MARDNLDLQLATTLSITFEFQKMDVWHETVHQHATEYLILCPILRWTAIIQRILSYPSCNQNSLVSTVFMNDQRKLVTSAYLVTQLQAAAKRIGENVLGFSHLDIGTHTPFDWEEPWPCIWRECQFFMIMLIGLWPLMPSCSTSAGKSSNSARVTCAMGLEQLFGLGFRSAMSLRW